MRQLTIAGAALATVALAGTAQGQDEQAVKQAILTHYEAANSGDTPTVIEQHSANFNGFLLDLGPLVRFDSRDEQRKAWIDNPDADFVADLEPRDIEVMLVGDVAIATLYLDGSWGPRAAPVEGPFRVTEVWVKEDGAWKELHHHDSPLR